jgi:hypothetical protein
MLGHDAQQLAARMAKVIHGGVASEVPPADSPVSPSDSSSSSSGSGSSNGTQNPSNNASRPQPTRPLMPYHAPNAKMQQEAMMVEPSASSVLAQRHTRGTPSLEVASVPTGARAHSGASVASGGAHFSDPERRATRFPQHLIPSDFTHVQLIFRSKNTLLFKARRRVAQRSSATASGSSAPVSSTASSLHPQLALVRGVSSLPILDPLGDLHSLTTSSNDASSPHASERPAASGLPHGEERQCNEGKRYEMVVLKMPNLFSINKEATGGAQTNTQLAGADDEPDVAGGTRAGDLTQLGGVDSSLKAAAAQAPAAAGFSAMQLARIKQFMLQVRAASVSASCLETADGTCRHSSSPDVFCVCVCVCVLQYSIAKQLQNKSVAGLVQLRMAPIHSRRMLEHAGRQNMQRRRTPPHAHSAHCRVTRRAHMEEEQQASGG